MAEGRFDNPVVASLTGFYDRFRKQELKPRFKETDNFNGKTVLITGANSGLGFAIAVQAAKRGAKVIMACRSQIPEAGEKVKKLSGSDNVEIRYYFLRFSPWSFGLRLQRVWPLFRIRRYKSYFKFQLF